MSVTVVCPGCGVELVFQTGAPLRVCDHCRSVIARRDRDLENLGKVVDLVQSQSPLELWLVGTYLGARFTLVGRAQNAHAKGGVWDEWYAAFDDGRWGWLAEAQGKLYLTFAIEGGGAGMWGFDVLMPGAPVTGMPGSSTFVVSEKGQAERRSAAGEIPYRLVPGERFFYADLSGQGGVFASLDYGQAPAGPPALYVGREVTLAELGWEGRAPADRPATVVKADRMACPECDGALELRAPDQTQRVGCPYCGTMIAVDGGKLAKLWLHNGPRVKPVLPLGGKARFHGVEWTLIGFIHKGTQVDSVWYHWDEYLLYDASRGFRWLVCANGHWSFVEPVPIAEIVGGVHAVTHRGKFFKHFQSSTAIVEQVVGECYWKVERGEQTQARDFVAPPLMLSVEEDAGEVNWSLGTYVPRAEVAKAFGVELVAGPPAEGVAPNQPYPYGAILRSWAIVAALAIVLAAIVFSTRQTRTVLDVRIALEDGGAAGAPFVWYSDTIELDHRRNLEVEIYAPVSDSWAYVEGDFVNEGTGLVQEFSSAIEYYSGSEGGESWSEGSSTNREYLSALPSGPYSLRLEIQVADRNAISYVRVVVRQGVPRWAHFWLLLLGVSILPIGVLTHKILFERRRWSESDHAP